MAMYQHLKSFCNNSVTTHLRNLIILATELYSTIKSLATPIMQDFFKHRNIHYSLCSQTDFQSGSVKAVNCGLKALRYLGPKIRIPLKIKNSDTTE